MCLLLWSLVKKRKGSPWRGELSTEDIFHVTDLTDQLWSNVVLGDSYGSEDTAEVRKQEAGMVRWFHVDVWKQL